MADIRPITIIAGKLKELPVADRLLVDSMLSNGPINIIGSSNVTQLLVKGNASQTTKLISLTDSSDAEKLSFDGIGNMYLENTTFANQEGVIYKNGERFLHNFNYGDNGTVTTQARNLFIGALAGNFTMGSTATVISQSSFNIGIGEESMRYNETGYNNSAIGFATLRMNTSGQGNLAIAANSLRNNLTGNYNVGIGGDALYNNLSGNSNVAIGSGAMRGNLTGGSNIAIGNNTLNALQSGVNNTAIGNSAAIGAVSSSSVTAVGSLALRLNTGDSNTAIGASALQKSTTGIGLTAVGTLALFELTTGQFNTAIGTSAIRGITTTDSNIGIGRNAGWKITGGVTDNSTPSESIFIGDSTVALANGQTNQIVIGYGAAGIGSNSVVIGNDSILTTALKGSVGIGTTTPQAKLDVTGTANELQLLVKGNATQTSNLQEWQDSSSAILSNISKDGFLGVRVANPTTAVDLDVTGLTTGGIRIKTSFGYNFFQYLKPDGSNLLRAMWDGGNMHHYMDGTIYYNMNGNGWILDGGGDGLSKLRLQNSASISLNPEIDGSTFGLNIGDFSYATAAIPYTIQTFFQSAVWAWNGSNGTSLNTRLQMGFRQQSTTPGDARFFMNSRPGGGSQVEQLSFTTLYGDLGVGITEPTSKLHIVGNRDITQTIIKGNATQTANIFETQDSTSTVQVLISGAGTFQTNKDRVKSTETSTGTATMADTIEVHICNSASAYVLTLPTHKAGKEIRIININSGRVTLTPTSGTVKGSATEYLDVQESLILLSNGTNWL